MPQNTTIQALTTWTLLTDTDVTQVTFQNSGSQAAIFITGTQGTTPPSEALLGLVYRPGEGEVRRALADLFPGVSGVNRLWAKGPSLPSNVFVSHA